MMFHKNSAVKSVERHLPKNSFSASHKISLKGEELNKQKINIDILHPWRQRKTPYAGILQAAPSGISDIDAKSEGPEQWQLEPGIDLWRFIAIGPQD